MNNAWQDEDIARVLADLEPQPSEQFRQRMQVQPWIQEPMTTPTHVAPKSRPIRRLIPLLGLLATLLIAGVVFATPLRALAQEMLEWVVRLPGDTATVAELEENVPPIEEYKFNLTLEEAEQAVGFDAWELPVVPDGFQIQQIGAIPVEQMIMFIYATEPFPEDLNTGLPPHFMLSQQPAARAASSTVRFPVGASAAIETVQVGDVTGEYMEGGGWCGGNSDPETELRWCPSPNERVLRWERDQQIFMLSAMDKTEQYEEEPSLSREQMIALAASIAPREDRDLLP